MPSEIWRTKIIPIYFSYYEAVAHVFGVIIGITGCIIFAPIIIGPIACFFGRDGPGIYGSTGSEDLEKLIKKKKNKKIKPDFLDPVQPKIRVAIPVLCLF